MALNHSRILVTGADGFVGKQVQTRLTQLGADVIPLGSATGIDIRDATTVSDSVRRTRPHVLIHLAGVSGPTLLGDQPDVIVDINCRGTTNVLEAALRANNVPTIVASSVSGYTSGTPDQPVPVSVYGTTKRFAELLCQLYRRTFGLICTAVRIGSVYGPQRRIEDTITRMLTEAITHRTIHYDPNGNEPLVHITDTANILAALALAPHWAEQYDLVTTPLSHHQLAQQVAANIHPAPILIPAPTADNRTWPITFDSRPILAATGQTIAISAARGISETVRHRTSLPGP